MVRSHRCVSEGSLGAAGFVTAKSTLIFQLQRIPFALTRAHQSTTSSLELWTGEKAAAPVRGFCQPEFDAGPLTAVRAVEPFGALPVVSRSNPCVACAPSAQAPGHSTRWGRTRFGSAGPCEAGRQRRGCTDLPWRGPRRHLATRCAPPARPRSLALQLSRARSSARPTRAHAHAPLCKPASPAFPALAAG